MLFRKMTEGEKHIVFILNKIFIQENRYNINKVAASAGKHRDWIYKMIEGKRKASLYESCLMLFQITGDKEFLNAMIWSADHKALPITTNEHIILPEHKDIFITKLKNLINELEKM